MIRHTLKSACDHSEIWCIKGLKFFLAHHQTNSLRIMFTYYRLYFNNLRLRLSQSTQPTCHWLEVWWEKLVNSFNSGCISVNMLSYRKKLCWNSSWILLNHTLALFKCLMQGILHKKWSFPLRISSVNKTKSTVFYGFGHIYWRSP